MARTKKMSATAKRRALQRQEARLRRELDKVVDKLEQCLICDSEKLEKEVRRLEAKHTKERDQLAKRLGVDAKEIGMTSKKKAAKKTASKKKAAKKKTAKKKTAAKKKSAKKKTAKKKTAKKGSKKSSAVSG